MAPFYHMQGRDNVPVLTRCVCPQMPCTSCHQRCAHPILAATAMREPSPLSLPLSERHLDLPRRCLHMSHCLATCMDCMHTHASSPCLHALPSYSMLMLVCVSAYMRTCTLKKLAAGHCLRCGVGWGVSPLLAGAALSEGHWCAIQCTSAPAASGKQTERCRVRCAER